MSRGLYCGQCKDTGAIYEGYLREFVKDNWASISYECGGTWIEFEEVPVYIDSVRPFVFSKNG